MAITLEQSHAYCRQLSRKTAKNFGFTFLTLPPRQRQSMYVLYAFLRLTDDWGDDESRPIEQRRERLREWRADLLNITQRQRSEHPVWPALADLLVRDQIDRSLLFDVISGVERDLEPVRYQSFADLADYCYLVAGAVGRCCIRIWGYHDRRADGLAVDCGMALQLTNILRDVVEDYANGRIYLPQEDLVRFGLTPQTLVPPGATDKQPRRRPGTVLPITSAHRDLIAFEVQRTRDYYRRAEQLFECLDRPGQRILRAMLGIYGGLLDEIEQRNFDVFSSRVRLSRWRKLWLTGQAYLWPLRTVGAGERLSTATTMAPPS